MNKKSEKKRQQRVRQQKLLAQESLRKENKEKTARERLQYLTRVRKTPIVKPDDSPLERNIKVLEQAMAEHEALLKFREENKNTVTTTEPQAASIFETKIAGDGDNNG